MRLNPENVGNPGTTTLYKEDFAHIQILPTIPAKTQLAQQLRRLIYQHSAMNRACILIPSISKLSTQLNVEKSDVLHAIKTMEANGYDVECPSDASSIYLFPQRIR